MQTTCKLECEKVSMVSITNYDNVFKIFNCNISLPLFFNYSNVIIIIHRQYEPLYFSTDKGEYSYSSARKFFPGQNGEKV